MSDEELNKILDKKYTGKSWVPIIQAEIIGEQVAKSLSQPPSEKVKPVIVREHKKTKTIDKKDFPVRRMRKLMDISVPGKMREFTIRSPSDDFTIKIEVDGRTLIERTFTQLSQITDYSEMIDVFEDEEDGYFVVNLTGISFSSSFELWLISLSGAITFNNIFGVWDEYV